MKKSERYYIYEGEGGGFLVPEYDKESLDFIMLLEGETTLQPIRHICREFGYRSTQSYYEKLQKYKENGYRGLLRLSRGPKSNYRRTPEVNQEIVQIRFQRPELNAAEIAGILSGKGYVISNRSVERTLTEYGISLKKNL